MRIFRKVGKHVRVIGKSDTSDMKIAQGTLEPILTMLIEPFGRDNRSVIVYH